MEKKLNTYVLKDEEYMGPGYFIITEENNNIIRFAKLFHINGHGMPYYVLRAFETGYEDNRNNPKRTIEFQFLHNEQLFQPVSELSISTESKKIFSVDPSSHGDSYVIAITTPEASSLIINKDVLWSRHASDYIDIDFGDHILCKKYKQIAHFYENLEIHHINEATEKDMQKIKTIMT